MPNQMKDSKQVCSFCLANATRFQPNENMPTRFPNNNHNPLPSSNFLANSKEACSKKKLWTNQRILTATVFGNKCSVLIIVASQTALQSTSMVIGQSQHCPQLLRENLSHQILSLRESLPDAERACGSNQVGIVDARCVRERCKLVPFRQSRSCMTKLKLWKVLVVRSNTFGG